MKKINTQEKILKFATKEFSKNGYEGASMNNIAKKAHINKALIYYYFKNKDELFEQILTSYYKDVYTYVDAIPIEGKSPLEQISTIATRFTEFIDTIDPGLTQILMRDVIGDGKYLKKFGLPMLVAPILSKVSEIYEKGKKEGDFEEVDIVVLFFQIVGSILVMNSLKLALSGTDISKLLFNGKYIDKIKTNIEMFLDSILTK